MARASFFEGRTPFVLDTFMLPDALSIEHTGSCVTVYFTCEHLTAELMQTAVNECAERMRYSNARRFIFDLAGVNFLASDCLNVLVNFASDVEPMRGKIAVASAQDNVANLFYITRLERVFGLYDDPSDAAAAI
jgi:anti-anti-sigma factor